MAEQYTNVHIGHPPKERHGMAASREYKAWSKMKCRCHNPRDTRYNYYGARGIRVCDRWRASFSEFFGDMGPCPVAHSIDRIDNDGNYEPGNCRWADKPTQMKNRSNAVMLTFEGRTMNLCDWAKELGVNWKMLQHRLDRGWTVDKTLGTPRCTYWSRRRATPAT
jgi:hypothetical protein